MVALGEAVASGMACHRAHGNRFSALSHPPGGRTVTASSCASNPGSQASTAKTLASAICLPLVVDGGERKKTRSSFLGDTSQVIRALLLHRFPKRTRVWSRCTLSSFWNVSSFRHVRSLAKSEVTAHVSVFHGQSRLSCLKPSAGPSRGFETKTPCGH